MLHVKKRSPKVHKVNTDNEILSAPFLRIYVLKLGAKSEGGIVLQRQTMNIFFENNMVS